MNVLRQGYYRTFSGRCSWNSDLVAMALAREIRTGRGLTPAPGDAGEPALEDRDEA
jgi:hypothetical protein